MRLKLKQMIGVLALAAVAAMLVAAVGTSAAGASEFKTTGAPTFLGEGLGAATFLSSGLNVVTCEKSHSKGSIENSSLAKVIVTYFGKCELHAETPLKFTEACPTITTKELDIKPISKLNGGTKTGLLFAALSGTIATFTCTGSNKVEVKVTGSVLCESTPIGKLSFTGKVICKKGAKHGEQEFTSGENTQQKHTVTDELMAESTLGIFKTSEKDSQETTEDVTYSAEVEQTA
jgi:hypothetical protein